MTSKINIVSSTLYVQHNYYRIFVALVVVFRPLSLSNSSQGLKPVHLDLEPNSLTLRRPCLLFKFMLLILRIKFLIKSYPPENMKFWGSSKHFKRGLWNTAHLSLHKSERKEADQVLNNIQCELGFYIPSWPLNSSNDLSSKLMRLVISNDIP